MEEYYAKFDKKQAQLLYEIKIQENKIYEKQREEKNKFLNDSMRMNTRGSGAFYKLKIKLCFKHIEERASIYLDSQFSEIEKGKLISKELKNHIMSNIRSFIGNIYQGDRAEFRGLLIHDGLSKSILAETFENNFEVSLQRTLLFFINKIDYEVTKRNKEFQSIYDIQEEEVSRFIPKNPILYSPNSDDIILDTHIVLHKENGKHYLLFEQCENTQYRKRVPIRPQVYKILAYFNNSTKNNPGFSCTVEKIRSGIGRSSSISSRISEINKICNDHNVKQILHRFPNHGWGLNPELDHLHQSH